MQDDSRSTHYNKHFTCLLLLLTQTTAGEQRLGELSCCAPVARQRCSPESLYVSWSHQRATIDYMTDVARTNSGLSIHNSNLLNKARINASINKFDSGTYDRLQFLKTVSHSLDAHIPSVYNSSPSADNEDDDEEEEVPQKPFTTDAAATAASTSSSPDSCEVCLLVPRSGVADMNVNDIRVSVRRVLVQWQQSIATAVLCAAHVLIWCCTSTTECEL